MTWEYRVLHEAHEVAGGTQEDTYGIVEAYYAKPGKASIVLRSTGSDVACGRCGIIATNVTADMALHLSGRHCCPDRVEMWSEPRDAHGETVEELVSDLVLMLRACWKPVLERRDLPGPETQRPPPLPHWHVRAMASTGLSNLAGSPLAFGPWTGGWRTETMGQAVDAFVAAKGPFPAGTRFEVKPYDG